jgi:hypothetical protein
VFPCDQDKEEEKPLCAVKLNMMEAYDRVEWTFLERMMLRTSFFIHWVEMIMRCVRTVLFSVKMNGCLLDSFSPTIGLRQGDPLSLRICSSSVLKVFQPYFGRHKKRRMYPVLALVEMDQL